MTTRSIIIAGIFASALVAGRLQARDEGARARSAGAVDRSSNRRDRTAPSAVGTVEPRFKTNLGFRVLGRLIARPVNVGDLVEQGQTVAAIDPTALELAVRSAKADLSKARLSLPMQARPRSGNGY